MATYTVPTRIGFFNLGIFFGNSPAIPCDNPRQLEIQGQRVHFGDRGVHIVAPKSITA